MSCATRWPPSAIAWKLCAVRGLDAESGNATLAMLERQVGHLVRLVDDLMEVSRITRGKIELRKELVTVVEVVQRAVETCRPFIDAAGHRLSVELPSDALILQADPFRLAQVLTNLLDNAAKYTEPGGEINLTATREGPNAVISVRDTGPGIPADMLPRIFDLFVQLDRSYARVKGGLGIGLTLARTLVDLHGGRIEVRSEGPGKGSEFAVRIPLAPVAAAGAGNKADERRINNIVGRRILVVDDNRDAADSLSAILRLAGGVVRSVNSGPAALGMVGEFQPSLVFLDLGMPGMDGNEVARQLRRRLESRGATLIAVTGWGQAEDRRKTKEAGFDQHLVKPVDLEAIQAALASAQ